MNPQLILQSSFKLSLLTLNYDATTRLFAGMQNNRPKPLVSLKPKSPMPLTFNINVPNIVQQQKKSTDIKKVKV